MSKNRILDQMPIDLGDDLVLRFATREDTDDLVDFNARLHEELAAGLAVRDLMSGMHPTTQASDFTIVEDTKTRKIVSSMCLISQTWTYGGIPFNLGRPEFVATEPDYRRRGLVRKQFDVIHAISAQKGELMLGITGIPWYYRLFGYEMALDLEANRILDGVHVPAKKKGNPKLAASGPNARMILLLSRNCTSTQLIDTSLHALVQRQCGHMNSTGAPKGVEHSLSGQS
jgi:hypothetical protein